MSPFPTLSTKRFRFRAFVFADIGRLVALANEHRIADTAIGVPHPFTAEFARMCISLHQSQWQERRAIHWAVHAIGDDKMAGYAGLNQIDAARGQGEMRFWVGCGTERFSHAVEWSEALASYALSGLNLTRVYALQLARHTLAGRVLRAIGMREEGFLRKRIEKGGLMEELCCWGMSKHETEAPVLVGAVGRPGANQAAALVI
jgi:RimJ/RimL family protein N-acetyltransferase